MGQPFIEQSVIAYGTENKSNANGVYNAFVLLSHMQRDTILTKKPEIIAFTKLVEGNGSKTAERASILRTRLDG